MSRKRIKKRKASPPEITSPKKLKDEINYPVFCFKHTRFKFRKDFEFYRLFIERLHKISSLDWKRISADKRHGFGFEKIPCDIIKLQLPPFVTPEVKHLLAFRATGNNRPFLGIRRENVFHIIFVEEKFGDVYDHD